MPKKSGKAAKTTKPNAVSKAAANSSKPRRLKKPKYKSFRLQKRIKHPVKLPNVFKLTKLTAQLMWRNKGVLSGIIIIYGLVNLVLVQGLASGSDITDAKEAFDEFFTGNWGKLLSSLSLFTVMLSSAGNTSNQTAGAYQVFLALIASLAMIWAVRHLYIGTKFRVRDAYYRGMYPLVPFILVLLVIGLQIIPLLIGSFLYSAVISNGIAVYFVEKMLWALLYAMLALLTMYMLSSSLFALYIVTLPDMTPMKALRSARELVRFRRWTVMRKIFSLPVILLVAAAVIMVPIIIWLTPLAQWVFFILTMTGLLAIHTYMYTLYRELLNE